MCGVYRRQILTSKVDPRAVRVNIRSLLKHFLVILHTGHDCIQSNLADHEIFGLFIKSWISSQQLL